MSQSVDQAVRAARTRAAAVLRPDVHTLEVRGPDRVEFLDGMLSQDLRSLESGQGTWALKCTAKGRIEAYVRVRAAPEVLRVDVRREVADGLLHSLSEHIVMEDCQVLDMSAARDVVSLIGPQAFSLLEAVGLGSVSPELSPDAFETVGSVTVIRDTRFGLDAYELHLPPGTADKRLSALSRAGAEILTAEALEVLRVEAGLPREGAELDLETLPMEARLEHAVSLTKGCYVGQEVVARGTNLGQVNHLLVGLRLEGGLPVGVLPVELFADGKKVGELDSAVHSPTLGVHIGLGYVRREHEAPGQVLSYVTPAGPARAVVMERPFVQAPGASS